MNTPNPFVGPRSFRTGEPLFGRDHETAELLDVLIAERIVLLNSPSGAGKSSLLNAALLPRLRAEGFVAPRPMRVSQQLPPDTPLPPGANRFVVSLMLCLEEERPAGERLPLGELGQMTLDRYLDRLRPEGGGSVALILDQFEEILTVDPLDRPSKTGFFDQLAQALRSRDRWALFAMREEYVAALEPYAKALPTRLATRYRLELLGPEQAADAICRPAEAAGVTVDPEAAALLVRNLSLVRVPQPDGTTIEQAGHAVEPVQLQVVCRRLWSSLGEEASRIDVAHVQQIGEVDRALGEYYADVVQTASTATGVRERAIREWIGRELITEQGLRGQVPQQGDKTRGLDNRAIDALVDGYLVRADKRRGLTWYELAHDRLIDPIQRDNAIWLEAHLHPLQRQAGLWAAQGRSPGLLLRADVLADAEAWAAIHRDDLIEVEQQFLSECVEARAADERERRAARRIKRLAIGVTVAGAVAVAVAVFAIWEWAEIAASTARLRHQANVNEMLALDARIPELLRSQPVAGLIAAIEGVERSLALNGGRLVPSVRGHLALALATARERTSWRVDEPPTAIAFAGGGRIAVALLGGRIQILRLDGEGADVSFDAGPRGELVDQLAFTTDGDLLAAFGKSSPSLDQINRDSPFGEVRLWDRNGKVLPALPSISAGSALSVAFVPGEHTIVVSSLSDQSVLLYVCDPAECRPRFSTIRFPVAPRSAARSSHGELLLAFLNPKDRRGYVNDLRVWSLDGRLALGPLEPPKGSSFLTTAIIATPEQSVLVAAGATDGSVRVWDAMTKTAVGEPFGRGGPISGVAFGHGGQSVIGRWMTALRSYDLRGEETLPSVTFTGGYGPFALSPDGQLVAAGEFDELRILDMIGVSVNLPLFQPMRADRLAGSYPRTNAIAFSPDGELVAAGLGRPAKWTLRIPQGPEAPDAQLRSIDTEPGHPDWTWNETKGLAIDRDGGVLLLDRTGRLWMRGDLVPLRDAIEDAPSASWAFALASDGRLAAVAPGESLIKLLDLDTRNILRLDTGGRSVSSLAIDPTSRRIAANPGGALRLWRRDGTALFGPLRSEKGLITTVVFHPHNGTLLVGTDLGTVERRDESGKVLSSGSVLPRGEPVQTMIIDPSGETAFVAGKSLKILDLTDSEPRELEVAAYGQNEEFRALAITRDGRLLAAATEHGRVYLWRVSWREWLSEACNRLRHHPVFRYGEDPRRQKPDACGAPGVDCHLAYQACTDRVWRNSAPR